MKRILLISPRRGSDFATRDELVELRKYQFPMALMPPLDLATLKALTPPHIQVDIWDESVSGPADVRQDWTRGYDLVGLTAYNLHLPWAVRIGRAARQRGVPVVIGGPGASSSPEACRGIFDTVFIGEAEFTWRQFLEDWQHGEQRQEYRQVQRPDVDESPAPCWDGFAGMASDYLLGPVQTTRGCPFDCEFCDVIHLFGRQPRHKSIATILSEVEALQRLGMRMIFFCDDNFIGRPRYAKELLRELIPLNASFPRPIGFTTQLTLNVATDEELLELLADANFHWVLIGIESPREASLREANKPQNYKADLVHAIRRIQSYGILVKGAMIVGFDHDDQAIFDEVYDFLRSSCVLINGLSMLHAYPGTPLLARLQKAGRVVELEDETHWEHTRPITNIIPKQMTRLELFQGYRDLIQRIRSWEYFGACAKDLLQNIKRPPNVPRPAAPDSARSEVFQRALQMLDEKDRAIVLDVLQATLAHAPFMLERIVAALFRFGGTVAGLPRVIQSLDERIELESRPDYKLRIDRSTPRVPVGFKQAIQWEAFPETYQRLRDGLQDERRVIEGLIRVWKGFLIRWAPTFETLEDYHREHLRELCDRTVEEGNRGDFDGAGAEAVVHGSAGSDLRRLAGEVLVSVEQDLRGVSGTVAVTEA